MPILINYSNILINLIIRFQINYSKMMLFVGIISIFAIILPWDAVKLTLQGFWLHLSFCGHSPYRFRSNDGSCSELAPELMFDNFLLIPDAESLPFYPLVLKLVVCTIILIVRLRSCALTGSCQGPCVDKLC